MNDILMRRDDYKSMLKELDAYEAAGINLFLCGDFLSARDIAYACCVREEGAYMCDFIPDHSGALKEIRFNCISKKTSKKRNFRRKKAV